MKNSLKEFASAKFIRFLPTKYNVFKVLRVEAYGILFTKGSYLFSFLPLRLQTEVMIANCQVNQGEIGQLTEQL